MAHGPLVDLAFVYLQLEEEIDLPDIPVVDTPPTLESILNEVRMLG